jgi:hypothetical protein
MQTDYKISQMTKDDLGNITRAKVRFYEGETLAKDELDIDGKTKPVTRYRRSALVKEFIYQPREFKAFKGQNIREESELLELLNNELGKDKSREALTLQKNG